MFEDLRPYICTFGGCLDAARLFTRRRLWFQHELAVHRIYWTCNGSQCNCKFETKSQFEDHMRQSHKDTFTEKQLPAIAELCKRSTESIGDMKCPLCAQSLPTSKALRHHLGSEMEELALFVLPRGEDCQRDDSHAHCESNYIPVPPEQDAVALIDSDVNITASANEDAHDEGEPRRPSYYHDLSDSSPDALPLQHSHSSLVYDLGPEGEQEAEGRSLFQEGADVDAMDSKDSRGQTTPLSRAGKEALPKLENKKSPNVDTMDFRDLSGQKIPAQVGERNLEGNVDDGKSIDEWLSLHSSSGNAHVPSCVGNVEFTFSML